MKRILRSTRPATAVVLALAGLGVLAPGAGAVAPVVSEIGLAPLQRPLLNEASIYRITVDWGSGQPAGTVQWTFTGPAGDPTTPPPDAGVYTARFTPQDLRTLRVSVTATPSLPSLPIESVTKTASFPINRRPNAGFAFNPTTPLVGQDVLFASSSSDPDADGLTFRWSFEPGATSPRQAPTYPFATAGRKTVILTVEDPWGATDQISRAINVAAPPPPPPSPAVPTPANAVPSAAFAYSPRLPVAGQQIEFASSAADPEGQLREQLWDLDGDGQFDDARGDEVLYTFSKSGQKTVRLRVVDAAGKAAVRERTLAVTAAPRARAGFLNPFPVVRLNGEVRRRGAMVRLLSVKAPRGSRVHVRCSGKSCKVKKRTQTVRRKRVRFKAFERAFRAGTELEIFVRKRGRIGKYTKFSIRAGDAPERTDRCLPPGAKRPRRCGGS